MTPSVLKNTSGNQSETRKNEDPGERIVISGISGLYPDAHNIKEFEEILYNKINPVRKGHSRYDFNHPEVARYLGVMPHLELFDAQFFRVHYRMSEIMDPLSRKLLEHVYQAIFDAGVCPESLSGKKVGVFVGVYSSESEKAYVYKDISSTGLCIVGCSKSMFANRVSYWLNARGPSIALDSSSCSSITALELACRSLASGECEAAVVAGMRACLHPHTSINYSRVTTLSKDGKTRSFDENASGSALSETINVLFLQKAKSALRTYADVMHVKCEYNSILRGESGPQYGFCRDAGKMAEFIKSFYDEVDVRPDEVEYVEAFGSAVPEADKSEIEAIDEVYCQNRDTALLVGSVISNIGYTEAASGIASITKVILGYRTGLLAGNLHLDNIRQDIPALNEGRIQLLKDHQPFSGGYAAVNAMSITGINAHVLLNYDYKPKDIHRYHCSFPYLVTVSGRQETSVQAILDDLKSRPVDPEELALFHNIHTTNTTSHMGRGYAILGTDDEKKTVCLRENVEYFDDTQKSLWFVYSGMGSQWAGMGAHLMQIPIFADAIHKCKQVLDPKGIDIVRIITSEDNSIFNNILHSFVGIAAIQIGLTDILRELGLVPDKIIGHSVGELGCAYADNCLTAEEMILCAYYRGLVSLQTPFINGAMAAVGMGYQQIIKICPPDIEVACHNSSESCTISGPADSIKTYCAKLTQDGIFAKEVNTANIAYHSRYIAEAGPKFRQYLRDLIKTPKLRSDRWISSSVPQDKWNEPQAKYSSAEYHTNNLLCPVLFEESSRLIPSNAVLVEVGPHGLLQAILKRALPETCKNIPLTLRGNTNLIFFLEGIGKIYMEGYVPKISALYPKIEFPVSTTTPMLSHMVKWVHSEVWNWPTFIEGDTKSAAACKFVVSVQDDEYSYLKGHVIRAKNVYPFASVLMDVWDTLAMVLNKPKKSFPVHFSDVCLHAQPLLHEQRQLKFSVAIHRAAGRFEVMSDLSKIATGFITAYITEESSAFKLKSNESDDYSLHSNEIYELAFNRDYSYRADFRSIHSANASLTGARLHWQNSWELLIDGMLQLNAFRRVHDTVSQPVGVRKICLNPDKHFDEVISVDGKSVIPVNVFDESNCTRCGGVVLENIQFRDLPPIKRSLTLKALNPSSLAYGSENYMKLPNICKEVKGVQLQCANVGDLNSLHWTEAPSLTGPRVVTVHYAGVNITDVERSLGTKPLNKVMGPNWNSFGMEYSGKMANGQRVMGLVENGAIKSQVLANPNLLWPVPAHWSLEDAATVPLAYCLAYYCLALKFPLAPRSTVLIHGGAGALGQAAIAVALAYRCTVITTVSTSHKKKFLLKMFPDLKEEHIGYSRDGSFSDMVMNATNGRGFDIGISCVKGSLKTETLKCCAANGITYDTVQIQDHENYTFGMCNMTKSRSYITVDLISLFQHQNIRDLMTLQRLVSEGIAQGHVRPLSRAVFEPRAAPLAFRRLAASRHCGRILIHMKNAEHLGKPTIHCTDNQYHLVVTDNEALGLLLAEKLVNRGAKKLHIQCPRPLKLTTPMLRHWLKQDVDLSMSSEDLSSAVNIKKLLASCNPAAAVEGIHVIVSENNDGKTLNRVKTTIQNLDHLSRELCPDLKYFTILNANDSVGQDTCVDRQRLRLPITMLRVAALNKISDINLGSGVSRLETINALEDAILSKHPLVIVDAETIPSSTLLQKIAAIADLNIPEDMDPNVCLSQLGMDLSKTPAVSAYIQDIYNLSISDDTILELTISKMRELEETLKDRQFKKSKGLHKFFSYIEPDELNATAEMIFPPTLFDSTAGKNEVAVKQNQLWIIPGLEGCFNRFVRMCERLKLPALVLQPGVDRPHETIHEMASRYFKTIFKNIQDQGEHFYLLGYETGVLVALELAALLEERGMTGTIFCVGGGPQNIISAIDEVISSYRTQQSLQEAITRHTIQLMKDEGVDETAIHTEFIDSLSWNENVEKSVHSILGFMSHSAQYAIQYIQTAYSRLQQSRGYRIRGKPLRSKIIVLKPTDTPSVELHNISQKPIVEYQLCAPLEEATCDTRCASIINRHLSQNILDEFENKNRCETYILNPDAITYKR